MTALRRASASINSAMKPKKSIEHIIEQDGRYPLEAVQFIREGLNYTVTHFFGDTAEAEGEKSQLRHVSGDQLCDGLRQLALQRWGLMARSVLAQWNITRTRDFGEIVFLLVNNDWMHKQPTDAIEDFEAIYDFTHVFEKEFEITLES
jgi:uncharacterized repeat protein (TIGR04138 family)